MPSDYEIDWYDLIEYKTRPAPSPALQPMVELDWWRVIEDAQRSKHLYGRLAQTETYRMTTVIVSFDPVQRRWMTLSGRVYLTHVNPGKKIETDLLAFVASHHRIFGPVVDVTESIWGQMRTAMQ